MASVRQHLVNLHKVAAEHHTKMAQLHKKHLQKAAAMEEDDKEQGPTNEHHNAFHREAMAAHQEAAERHAQMCQDCEKTVADQDLSKLVPTGVSGITPDNPMYRAIPREGQRAISETPKPVVPLEFEHMVKIEED
ncbi:MAG: hypothetical protein WBP79_16470 [Candidatus Acidiferrales bacterium]